MKIPDQPNPDILDFLNRCGAVSPAAPTAETAKVSPSAEPFPLDAVPAQIRSIVLSLSRYSRLDLSFHAMAAIAIVSAGIGRWFKIQSSYFTAPTHGNLLVALCANTTKGKGILEQFVRPVYHYEDQLVDAFAEARPGHIAELKILESRLRDHVRQAGKAHEALAELYKDNICQLQSDIDSLKAKIEARPELYLNHFTGACLRNTLARNGGDCFLYSVEGSGHLLNAFNGGDPLLGDLLLSGFSNERVKKDTTACHYGGSPCLSGLFALQTWRLREIMFSKAAAPLGFLNRLIVVDAGRLPKRELDPDPRPDPETQAAWHRLVSNIFNVRLSNRPALTLPLSRDAEDIFLGYRREVDILTESMPGEIQEHLGRFPEIAMRLSAVFLALEHMGMGYPVSELSDHGQVAENAVIIARWLLDHRLAIHQEHLFGHYHECSQKLEKLLKKNGGEFRECLINAHHGDLSRAMDFLLQHYPEKFARKEVKTGKRGPHTALIRLKAKPAD